MIHLDNAPEVLADLDKSREIAEVLEKHYPGYLWAVRVDHGNNIATVNALALSGQWGFYLHLDKLDPGMKAVVRAGGEILERHKLARARMNEDHVMSLGRDLRGNILGADHA